MCVVVHYRRLVVDVWDMRAKIFTRPVTRAATKLLQRAPCHIEIAGMGLHPTVEIWHCQAKQVRRGTAVVVNTITIVI